MSALDEIRAEIIARDILGILDETPQSVADLPGLGSARPKMVAEAAQ